LRYTEEQLKAIDHKFDVIAESALFENGESSDIIISSMIAVLIMEIVGWPAKDSDTFDTELATQFLEIVDSKYAALILKELLTKH